VHGGGDQEPAAAAVAAIRPARREEIGEVLALLALARTAAATTPDDERALTGVFERDAGALLVAELEGRLVGTLIATWDGWRGNMYRLAVLPDHRRRGVATRLVQAGHERLRALGARRITALLGDSDTQAASFWLALGYDHDEHVKRFVAEI